MALRNIRVIGDRILTQPAREITEVTPRIRELAADMLETMYEAPGVGLAAPQVGILKKLIVVDVSEEGNEPYVVINPKLVKVEGTQFGDEGCLSVPGKQGTVMRPNHVIVNGYDLDMNKIEIDAEGFLARAFCHEIDHLNGILYVDKVEKGTLKNVSDEKDED